MKRVHHRIGRIPLFIEAFPVLATLGPFASFSPGSVGFPYFYRVLIAAAFIPAVLALMRSTWRQVVPVKAFIVFVFVWLVWAPITLLWSPALNAGLREMTGATLCIIGAFCGLAITQGSADRVDAFRNGWIAAFVITSFIAAWELLTKHHLLPLVGMKWIFPSDSVATTFNNPNNYAYFLIACMGPSLAFVLTTRSTAKRWALSSLIVIAAGLTVATKSRFGIIGAVLVLVVAAYWICRRSRRGLWMILSGIGILSLALATTVVRYPGSRLGSRLLSPFEYTGQSNTLRGQLTDLSVKYILQAPVFGNGAGSFQSLLIRDHANVIKIVDPHDTFLEITLEYGLIVAIPLAVLLIALIWSARRFRGRGTSEVELLGFQIIVGLFAVAIGGVATSSSLAEPVWWLLIGYLCALAWRLTSLRDFNSGSTLQSCELLPGQPYGNGRPQDTPSWPNIAVFTPQYPPAHLGGGPVRTVSAMVKRARQPERLFVFTSDRDLGLVNKLPVHGNIWSREDGANVYYVSDNSLLNFARGILNVRKKKPRIVYLNSLFNVRYSLIPQLLTLLGVWSDAIVVVAPRGELDQGALDLKARKKALFLRGYRWMGLHHDLLWHASSEREAADIRTTLGYKSRVIVRENETLLPVAADVPQQNPSAPLSLVFISRLSPKKGLDRLLEALMLVPSAVNLDIFGNEEDKEYYDRCTMLAAVLPPHIRVNFNGSVEPDAVRGKFGCADAFAFPTAGENFGHVIAESLSASCPVLVADVTPWSQNILAGGGVLISSNEVGPWAAEIRKLAELSPEARHAMRLNAGQVYTKWRAVDQGPSIFDLILNLKDTGALPASNLSGVVP